MYVIKSVNKTTGERVEKKLSTYPLAQAYHALISHDKNMEVTDIMTEQAPMFSTDGDKIYLHLGS